jgi:membrane fusion protein, multidrug efflux system
MSFVRVAPAILSVFVLAGCSSTEARPDTSDTASGRGRNPPGAIPVVTVAAEVKPMPVTLGAVGTAEAISTVDIRAQITGQLQEIRFSPGQDVRKGQPLFVLDRRPLEAALRQAEAIVEKDEAQLRNAALERQRAEDLLSRGILARSDYDTNVATAAALAATLAADKAQADEARLNLQYAEIRSPLDGRTGALNVHVGDLVRTNDTLPLVTINQVAPIYVTFSVPARFLTDIREAAGHGPLSVTATGQRSAMPGSEQDTRSPASALNARGDLTFIDNAVDSTTATIKLKATFPNRDREVWPGLFVQVSMQLSMQPHAVVVPSIAVQTSQQGQYVYVVKPDRTVELRRVSVDRQQGGETVIADGLKGGEDIVTEGQLRLAPGAHVTTGGHQAKTS